MVVLLDIFGWKTISEQTQFETFVVREKKKVKKVKKKFLCF